MLYKEIIHYPMSGQFGTPSQNDNLNPFLDTDGEIYTPFQTDCQKIDPKCRNIPTTTYIGSAVPPGRQFPILAEREERC